eukprot:SAG11_NODE_2145_length_3754_cov_2.172914_4_plen_147_part_00
MRSVLRCGAYSIPNIAFLVGLTMYFMWVADVANDEQPMTGSCEEGHFQCRETTTPNATGHMLPLCIPLSYVRDGYYDCVYPSHCSATMVDACTSELGLITDKSDENSTPVRPLHGSRTATSQDSLVPISDSRCSPRTQRPLVGRVG